MDGNTSFLEKRFKLSQNGTNVKTEITSGFTTFMTMAYILAVNPIILSTTGMDAGAVFTATAISAAIATLIMALFANLPFALAPGMGLNAMFAFMICGAMGASWQTALTAVFIEGIIFIGLTVFNVREAIINSIPMPIKHAISVGIGLFIALIGFTNAGIVVTGKIINGEANPGGLIVQLGDIYSPATAVAILGIIITSILVVRKVKGAILIGIIVTTIISIPAGVISLEGFKLFNLPPSIAPIALQFDFASVFTYKMFIILFTLLFVDMFDTIGTLIGVCGRANMLTEDGKVPNAKQALLADAVGTTVGAMLGTSTVTTYVESASGVGEGARTGLSALTVAVLFILSLFFSSIFLLVPGIATAPALIIVGMYMMAPISKIDWNNYLDAIPAFLTLAMMPFTYSIAEGITFGVLSYVIIAVLSSKTDKVKVSTYILSLFFILKLVIPLFT